MAATKIWSWLGYQNVTATAVTEYLLSRRQFQASMRRERLRADRNLTRFALLTLSFGRVVRTKELATIVKVLEARVRASDEPGWFAKRTIGVILPDTSAEGAWKLAEDLRTLLNEHNLPAYFLVYTYPSSDSGEGRSLEESVEMAVDGWNAATAQPLDSVLLQKLPIPFPMISG
jgi:GGDEF domain-containing protein